MANYRQIHTKIWKDRWFLDLKPEYKLLFIYLFSNERASISGIYELPKRVIAFEAGVDMETLDKGLQVFEDANKAYFRDGVVWVRNLRKYHETKSPKVQTRILNDLDEVRDCELKAIYCREYGIDRVSDGEDKVDIPPYKSSIVNSSNKLSLDESDSDVTMAEIPPEALPNHEEHQTVVQYIEAIGTQVRDYYGAAKNREIFKDAAHMVIGYDATIEEVMGFDAYWQKYGWYKNNGKASIDHFIDHWNDYVNGVNLKRPSTNGRHSQSPEKQEFIGGAL